MPVDHIAITAARLAMGREAAITPGKMLPQLAFALEPLPNDRPTLIEIDYPLEEEHR